MSRVWRAMPSKAELFARWEATLAQPLAPAPGRVALLTGLSDPRSSRLSANQHAVLDAAVAASGLAAVRTNFPFPEVESPSGPAAVTLAASLANLRQHLWALHDARYQRIAGAALARLIEASGGGLLLIIGSCGHAIADAMLARSSRHGRVRLLAFGATGPKAAPNATLVRGRADWISALFGPPAHHLIDAGHLDYWGAASVRAIVAEHAAAFAAEIAP